MISLGSLTPTVYVALPNVFLYFVLQHASLASQLPHEWLLQSFVIISGSELKKPIKLPIVFRDWRRIKSQHLTVYLTVPPCSSVGMSKSTPSEQGARTQCTDIDTCQNQQWPKPITSKQS